MQSLWQEEPVEGIIDVPHRDEGVVAWVFEGGHRRGGRQCGVFRLPEEKIRVPGVKDHPEGVALFLHEETSYCGLLPGVLDQLHHIPRAELGNKIGVEQGPPEE